MTINVGRFRSMPFSYPAPPRATSPLRTPDAEDPWEQTFECMGIDADVHFASLFHDLLIDEATTALAKRARQPRLEQQSSTPSFPVSPPSSPDSHVSRDATDDNACNSGGFQPQAMSLPGIVSRS